MSLYRNLLVHFTDTVQPNIVFRSLFLPQRSAFFSYPFTNMHMLIWLWADHMHVQLIFHPKHHHHQLPAIWHELKHNQHFKNFAWAHMCFSHHQINWLDCLRLPFTLTAICLRSVRWSSSLKLALCLMCISFSHYSKILITDKLTRIVCTNIILQQW